jgi:hypothetical protein
MQNAVLNSRREHVMSLLKTQPEVGNRRIAHYAQTSEKYVAQCRKELQISPNLRRGTVK